MATIEPTADLMDITTLANQLGVRVRYVRRLVDEKRIPYIKLGHFIRFDPIEISDWIDDARVGDRTR